MSTQSGRYVTISTVGEKCQAFVPDDLPPTDPLLLTGPLRQVLEDAQISLGRLDAASTTLAETDLFLFSLVRKEALLSSQIEGTQSSMADLLFSEAGGLPPNDDIAEVVNYVAAIRHGLRRIREDGFPVCLRLIREMHEMVLQSGRGSHKQPGEFRTSQNWVGGTRPGNASFVPPPPEELPRLLSSLERFLHDDGSDYSRLVRAGLAHVQFETIHPFLDGNGRVGRLLVTLLLCEWGILQQPVLYLSLFFKCHRDEYYVRLSRVRTEGDWPGWLEFFLRGVCEAAEESIRSARALSALLRTDRERVKSLGRPAASALRVYEELTRSPIIGVESLIKRTALSRPTVMRSLGLLGGLGIAAALPRKGRSLYYRYGPYVDILVTDTEPLAP
jgi:Fic family protein